MHSDCQSEKTGEYGAILFCITRGKRIPLIQSASLSDKPSPKNLYLPEPSMRYIDAISMRWREQQRKVWILRRSEITSVQQARHKIRNQPTKPIFTRL
ncbi:MAG TPA: hypothetical protein DIV79_08700 [Opitutae bacterium]|nr:hypothetical protein [Opitutae bacterium]